MVAGPLLVGKRKSQAFVLGKFVRVQPILKKTIPDHIIEMAMDLVYVGGDY